MKMEYYEEFLTLAKTDSFSKAAGQLSFTQAALTQHIQQMEALLGVRLFDRTTRSLKLSEYGRLAQPHAERILALKQEALSAITRQQQAAHCDLSIGIHPIANRYDILEKCHAFQAAHPEYVIRLRELLPEPLMQAMNEGEFDFMTNEEMDGNQKDSYARLCLDRDVMAAVLPADHPLSGEPSVSLSQLRDEAFILFPDRTFVYQMAVSACMDAGFTPEISYTNFKIERLMEMVARGGVASLMVRAPAEAMAVPGVVVIPVQPSVLSSVNLLYRNEKLSEAGNVFLRFMEQTERRIVHG